MSFTDAVDLLACPVCSDRLILGERALACPAGHSFDLARQGYVNLLGAAEPANADTAPMLAARARVHATGSFAPVAKALAGFTQGRRRLLEAGSGTAYFLAIALGGDPQTIGVAVDVSKAAARAASRTDSRILPVVADVWRRLPILTHSLDAVLTVFAPRNLPEFARVLRADGRLLAITPRPGHLHGLRDRHGLLEIPHDKASRLADSAAEFFDLLDTRVLRYRREVSADEASDLIAMGPNAFHRVPEAVAACEITVDVTLQVFRPLAC